MVRNVVKQKFTMIEATLDKSEKNQGLYEYICCMAIQQITNYEVGEWSNSKDFLEKFNIFVCDNIKI